MEVDDPSVSRGLRIPVELDAKILVYARRHGLVDKITTTCFDGKRKTIEVPNWSKAVRMIIEEHLSGDEKCVSGGGAPSLIQRSRRSEKGTPLTGSQA